MAVDDPEWLRCSRCMCDFALPYELFVAAHHSEAIYFYCPYGHVQHFRWQTRAEPKANPQSDDGKVVAFRRSDEATP